MAQNVVFEELMKHRLFGVQFTVFKDEHHSIVLENWKYTFRYTAENSDAGRRLVAIDMPDASDQSITTTSAKSSLDKILKTLEAKKSKLDRLPGKFFSLDQFLV